MTFDPLALLGAASAVIVFLIAVLLRKRGDQQLEGEEPQKITNVHDENTAQNSFLKGLRQTSRGLSGSLNRFFQGSADPEALEALEDALIAADVGVQTAEEVVQFLKSQSSSESTPEQLRAALAERLLSLIGPDQPLVPVVTPLHVILVVGVNGSGKTTTIGKLAHRYVLAGKSVLVAPGDTFRAGAIEQLAVWAERSGATCLEAQSGSDPASVIYNAIEAARSKNVDILICDTAGRLQSQSSLMDELSKINKVIQKKVENGPHETLLVLDSTIGQNALRQAEGFCAATSVSGIALTKLDGTAKGGVVIAVGKRMNVPVKLVGLGEGIDDLQNFSASPFVDALLAEPEAGS